MARPKPWLKLWIEWIHDPKMLELTLAERGVWVSLLALAQQCAADGRLVKSNGSPLTLSEIANSLHIATPKDMNTFKSTLKKMESAGSLVWNSGTLTIVHFAERQAKQASATKEAVKERVKRYREKKFVTAEPLHPLTTPLQLKDIEREAEVEVEGESVTNPLHSNGRPVTPEAILAEIAKCHEENFGIITPILSENFKDFVDNYHGPIEWVKEAFTEALTNNVRRWSYVEAILDRWQQEGRGHRKGGERGTYRRGDKETSAERLRQSLK